MKAKDRLIIEAAIKLFAKKGFSATSIQEIASESGISKGAFYLHFKSKESLLLAILNYYFEEIKKNVLAIEQEELSARDKFSRQLTVLYENLLQHKDFIIMQTREQAIPLNDEIRKLIYNIHFSIHEFYRKNILDIYGEIIREHVWDLSIMLEGIFHAYIRLLFLDEHAFNKRQTAGYILNRLDDMVATLSMSKEEPLISQKTIQGIMKNSNICINQDFDNISSILNKMRKELENSDENKDLLISLEVIEAEVKQEQPRAAVLVGMLSNFNSEPIFEDFITKIYNMYKLQKVVKFE